MGHNILMKNVLTPITLLMTVFIALPSYVVALQPTDMQGAVVAKCYECGNIISRSHFDLVGKRSGGDKEGFCNALGCSASNNAVTARLTSGDEY
jgi:hypothetical protein